MGYKNKINIAAYKGRHPVLDRIRTKMDGLPEWDDGAGGHDDDDCKEDLFHLNKGLRTVQLGDDCEGYSKGCSSSYINPETTETKDAAKKDGPEISDLV